MGRPAKHPILEFDGKRFYRKPSGYYKLQHAAGGDYMHRYVWEFHNGPIPDGHQVHHRDENKGNNAIGNLELLTAGDHQRFHAAVRDPAEMRRRIRFAQAAAPEWHASPEGIAWHREHGKKSWEDRATIDLKCVHCNAKFTALVGTSKRGFCSNACQSAARRASGVDNEQRACCVCGGAFQANRYASTKTCSKGCWRTELSRSKRSAGV